MATPLVDLGSVRLEGLREQGRGYRGQVWEATWCRALNSDRASKPDAVTSQSLGFLVCKVTSQPQKAVGRKR